MDWLPVSNLPLRFDANSGPVECLGTEQIVDARGVTETRFTLRLKRNRLYPDSGFQMFFPCIYHEGNAKFAAARRTVQIAWVPQDLGQNVAEQTVIFPPLPDVPAATTAIQLAATSSAGLGVDYFVKHGPGVGLAKQCREAGQSLFHFCSARRHGSVLQISVFAGSGQRGWRVSPPQKPKFERQTLAAVSAQFCTAQAGGNS